MRELYSKVALSLLFLHLSMGIPRGSMNPEVAKDSPSPSESSKFFGGHFGRSKKPHIVVILADDLGWNDVSFHGANQIPTPNIDAIAYNGIILNSHYVSAMCTPSRSSLMTGKLPIHLGMQHSVLLEPEPRGLPLKEKLLPQFLKDAGYKTHAIGKWHLGYYKKEYTPTYRGFDSHFGYWNGFQDYFTHTVQSSMESWLGFDMRRNMTVAKDTEGKYSTDIFTDEAVRVINEHDDRTPLFMYLAHLAPHSGNEDDPYQAPDEEIAKFSYIDDPERRVYAAMVSKLDASIGDVMAALRRRRMLDNSIILFMSDNGAPTMGVHNNSGSNYPLRGIKDSPWEGGVRGAAAIWSPLIKKPRRVSNQLISIADWLPTLWAAAGMDASALGAIDGYNMWPSLIDDRTSPRSEVLINIDDISNYSAIRRGDYKYVIGHTDSGDDWYGETGRLGHKTSGIPTSESYPDAVLESKANIAIGGVITAGQVMNLRRKREGKFFDSDEERSSKKMLTAEDVTTLRSQAIVSCNVKNEQEVQCNPVESPCLFNIKEDPCERINLAETRPIIVAALEQALIRYRHSAIPASNVPNDPLANPVNWEGLWVNWRDSNPLDPPQAEERDSPTCDEAVSMTDLANDEQQTFKISRGIQTMTELNSMKDHGRSID